MVITSSWLLFVVFNDIVDWRILAWCAKISQLCLVCDLVHQCSEKKYIILCFFFRTLVYEFAHQQYFWKFAHHDKIRTLAEKSMKNSYDKKITKIDQQQGEVVRCSTLKFIYFFGCICVRRIKKNFWRYFIYH